MLGGFEHGEQADQPGHFKNLARQPMQAAKNQRPGCRLELLRHRKKAPQPHAADVLQTVQISNQMFGALGDPLLAGVFKLVRILGVHAAADFEQHRLFELGRFYLHRLNVQYVTIAQSAGRQVPRSMAFMNFSEEDFENLRTRLRFKVCYEVGFACPDVDDIVQESLARFMVAQRTEQILNPAAAGAFLNGVCRNVISEYRRRAMREDPMPESLREPEPPGIAESDHLELRQAIAYGLAQLSERDRRLLRSFYLEEKSKEEILRDSGMSDQNFRVVLCRAKERFRAIYLEQAKHRRIVRHSGI